jgi:hypothetical protein
VNVTDVAAAGIVQGWCIPAECTYDDLIYFSEHMTHDVNHFIDKTVAKFLIHHHDKPPKGPAGGIQLQWIPTRASIDNWIDKTDSVFKLDVLLLTLWFLIFGLIPCIAGCVFTLFCPSKSKPVLAEGQEPLQQKVDPNIARTIDSIPQSSNDELPKDEVESTTQNFNSTVATEKEKFSLQKLFKMFHFIQIQRGFQQLYKTRSNPYDNRELDIFECIKMVCFSMGVIAYTT